MTTRIRRSSAEHHRGFQAALVDWQWPGDALRPNPLELGAALERWAAEVPEDAEVVAVLALGVASNLLGSSEHEAAVRAARAGLDASALDAPVGESAAVTEAWLAIVAADAAHGMDDAPSSRLLLERSLGPDVDPDDPIAPYLAMRRDLVGAQLAEAALEPGTAHGRYDDALVAAQQLLAGIDAVGPRWTAALFGTAGGVAMEQQAMSLFRIELEGRVAEATLGVARTGGDPAAVETAIEQCTDAGLPAAGPLALLGLFGALDADAVESTARHLTDIADADDEPFRSTWQIAIRALEADALLTLGEADRARRTLERVERTTAGHDAVALALDAAATTRAQVESGDLEAARASAGLALLIQTVVASRAPGLSLRLRSACEPALTGLLQAELARFAARPDQERRRRVSVLLEAIRAPEHTTVEIGKALGAGSPDDNPAADLLGRIAVAVAGRDDTLVVVIQHVHDGAVLVGTGGDRDDPIVVTSPSTTVQTALTELTEAAGEALLGGVGRDLRPDDGAGAANGRRGSVSDPELESLGTRALDAIAEPLRSRMLRARELIVLPDLSVGQDRVPVELLHDGTAFFGIAKVIARCLSLSHALRILEPPLVPRSTGRRALVVAVARAPGLPRLPSTETEAASVREAVGFGWDAESLADDDADPDGVLELAPLADVLHIACHGESAVGAEALVLGGGARLTAQAVTTRHPLRCATYLNACSLGRGRYVGGGVSRGVAYAFTRAGSPAVIANILPVEDESAADLASAFYAAAREHPVGEALRLARAAVSDRVGAALWSTTVLIGDPWTVIGDERSDEPDATAALLADGSVPPADRVVEAETWLRSHPDDLRLAGAIEFTRAMEAGDIDRAIDLARCIGHDIGEADARLARVDGSPTDVEGDERERELRAAIRSLERVRGAWEPAHDAYLRARDELQQLDPTYERRELQTFRFESGLTVNDRSDPAVDAITSMQVALDEHERFWRGDPALISPDDDVAAIARNAVVWGYLHRLSGIGVEAPYSTCCARRLAWRRLIPARSVDDVGRVMAGVLHFLWGRQHVTHLPGWMLMAHGRTIELAIERASRDWRAPGSPAAEHIAHIGDLLDGLERRGDDGSRFARARRALHGGGSGAPDTSAVVASVEAAIADGRVRAAEVTAELSAWIIGDVLTRATAVRTAADPDRGAMLALDAVLDGLESHEEGWYLPYLMDGFAEVRATGGRDVLKRWSQQLL